ncbi:unnamed protein product, partial [Prorocentrum cordatum]
ELSTARSRFREQWQLMNHDARHEAFEDWQNTPAEMVPADAQAPAYATSWGRGCRSSPISCEEFYEWHHLHGWPTKDMRVYNFANFTEDFECDAADDLVVRAEPIPDLPDFSLWGCGRKARPVPRATVPNVQQFHLIENGIHNLLARLTRPAADVGDVLIMVEGHSLENPASRMRFVGIISGTFYNPK